MKSPLFLTFSLAVAVAAFSAFAMGKPTDKSFWGELDPAYLDPNKINSWGWEDSPYVTEDDQTYYMMYNPNNFFPFFSGGVPVKIGPDRPGHNSDLSNPWKDSNIYVSRRMQNGRWSVPKHVDFADNLGACCAMVSADGNSMYLGRENAKGPTSRMDVYVSRRIQGDSWSTPENIGAPVNTEAKEDNPHISWDGNSLYFASDRPGSTGGKDIFVSHRTANGWGEPQLMAPGRDDINKGDEDQVWVSKDQRHVMFGREGVGLLAIHMQENGQWSSPAPFKPGTDKPIGEISFSNDMTKAYFAIVDFDKKDITISVSEKKSDGSWGAARSLDQ